MSRMFPLLISLKNLAHVKKPQMKVQSVKKRLKTELFMHRYFYFFISEGIKTLLGKHVRILLKCAVKMESKGDKTENRILVRKTNMMMMLYHLYHLHCMTPQNVFRFSLWFSYKSWETRKMCSENFPRQIKLILRKIDEILLKKILYEQTFARWILVIFYIDITFCYFL